MQAWDHFLLELEKRMGKAPVRKWLRPLRIIEFDACNLYLEAENAFQIGWFEEHVRPIAVDGFVNNNGRPIKVHFQKQNKQQRRSKRQASDPNHPLVIQSDPIDPSMAFSNFIFDDKGSLSVQFFKQLSPGAFNPVFLQGDKGVGKTHLLTACAGKLIAQGLSVFYVHAETFTQHVVEAIRSANMGTFREIYRNQDVLIIDDIHQLARRAATQEEFFHTFNTLHTAGRQIILSSHLLPSHMEEIESRLISRFEWGILMQLPPLSPQKMELVLKNRARLHHFPLSDAVCRSLIEQFPTSSKSMMRSLEALMLRHRSDQPIDVEQAQDYLGDLLEAEKKLQITPEKIVTATAAYYGIRVEDILGKSHTKECADPRKLAMYLCRKHLGLSYPAIGRAFDRDHSTVMKAIGQINRTSEFDNALLEIERAVKLLKS